MNAVDILRPEVEQKEELKYSNVVVDQVGESDAEVFVNKICLSVC